MLRKGPLLVGGQRLDLYGCHLTTLDSLRPAPDSIGSMNGGDVSTSALQRLADYVMQAALDAGYDVRPGKRTGARQRLAQDAGIDPGQLTRLLGAERMPDARYFAGLAKALDVSLTTLLVEAGIIPAETLTQEHLQSVRSHPITPDEVADSWGIEDDAGRQLVRATFESLRARRKQQDTDDQPGSAEAQG